jgi:Tfp pilus assembly protein PilX
MKKTALRRQRGVTLLVSLIMLVLITMLAITVFKLGKGNLQIVGNMQQRKQTLAAAQQAIEEVVSRSHGKDFTQTPADAVDSPCTTANTTCMSINGSGTNDVTTTVKVTCESVRVLSEAPNSTDLNWNDANDRGCFQGQQQAYGQTGVDTGSSICAASLWDIQATATDATTNSQITVDQGTQVRVPSTTACP